MANVGERWFARVEAGAAPEATRVRARLRRVVRGAPLQDWLLAGHLVVLLALTYVGQGATRARAMAALTVTLAWFVLAVALVRTPSRVGRLRSAFYRLSLVGAPVTTYLALRWVLPVIAPNALDAALLGLDLRVFRVEPAIAWDRLVTPALTEWFSFFYYSYFFVLAAYAIPLALALDDGPALREFAFGLLLLFCVGHIVYVVVPAWGPHVYVRTFARPLEGGVFWPLVNETVRSAGAGKDVFPSLHTAAPVFLVLYSIRHRAVAALRFALPVLVVFASQIVLATMFLRWHYLVDVVAGVLLAAAAVCIAPRVASWDERRLRRAGLGGSFSSSPLKSQ